MTTITESDVRLSSPEPRTLPAARSVREVVVVLGVLVLGAGWAGSTLSCLVDGRCPVPVEHSAAPLPVPLLLVLALVPYCAVLGWLTTGRTLMLRVLLATACHGLVTAAVAVGGATVPSPERLVAALGMAGVIAGAVILLAGSALPSAPLPGPVEIGDAERVRPLRGDEFDGPVHP